MIANITSVWTSMMEWLVDALASVQSVFVSSAGELTFLGTLSVIGVAMGVAFLVIGVVQNFLHLRG